MASLLAREAGAARIRVPVAMKTLEPDLQRLSARFRASGLEDPFQERTLKAVPPAALRGLLADARGRGLLHEGADWARQGEQLRDFAVALRQSFQRHLELDGGITLGAGRRH